uniref:NADH dehydrogenase [ubiquinone] 1 beta subcomplex subunit 5, mitochondrial n=1 Tax=Rhipicephalus zambeziensis TaxID=60191 RepID=A0A224Z514_9ACAR
MAVLSILRSARTVLPVLTRRPAQFGQLCPVRKSSDHMVITPSRFAWNLFKDHLHFYVLLGAIPLTIIITYINIVIGPPRLAEIPEGYEPEYWEYYDHPIKRFLAKHFMDNPQMRYEKKMNVLQNEHERVQLREIQWKVEKLIQERGDFQAWYYIPYDSKYTKKYQKQTKTDDFYSKTI